MAAFNDRRFPRLPRVTSCQVVRLDAAQNPQTCFVLMEDISGGGFKFTTNSIFDSEQFFLIHLSGDIMANMSALYDHKKTWARSGAYYLAQVRRAGVVDEVHGIYDVGAVFLESSEVGEKKGASVFHKLKSLVDL